MCEFKSLFIKFSEKINSHFIFNEPLSKHTSFRIGGPADILLIPKSISDLREVIRFTVALQLPVHIIGKGTNLVVSDSGIKGIVIKIANTFNNITINNEKIVCGAGTQLSDLLRVASNNSLSGLEFVAGIPGTLGGAITMNAGTNIGNMSQIVQDVFVMDFAGVINRLSVSSCGFSYRESIFQTEKLIILGATLTLKKGNRREIREKINKILAERKLKYPLDKPSAGCIFKNTRDFSAGELIEKVGLKGKRINDAQISSIHANFIVNLGNANAIDVLTLMNLARTEVSKLGINLNTEVNIIPKN